MLCFKLSREKILNYNDICDTLQAVDEVEVSFEKTLRSINNINHRYHVLSELKKKESLVKEVFEEEIQAAIRKPAPTKVTKKTNKSLKKKEILVGKRRVNRGKKTKVTKVPESFEPDIGSSTKVSSPRKSLKKEILPLACKKQVNNCNKCATKSPLPALPPCLITYKEYVPQAISLPSTNYTNEIHSAETPVVPRKQYGDLIQRLYRIARQKTQQETMDQEQTMDQEEIMEYQDSDQTSDCSNCCCSSSS